MVAFLAPNATMVDARARNATRVAGRVRDDRGVTGSRGHRRAALWLLPVTALAAVAVLFAGPSALVVCGDGHGLDRLAQSVSHGLGGGHVDGPAASYCRVPSDVTWILAGVVSGSVFVGVTCRRRRRSVQDLRPS
jgi:hypothetical protein